MDPKKRDFYQYYATMLEPWDGPASILFSDGDVMGAVLDRNGLRPSRYYITKDGRLILSSEVGALDIPADEVVRKDRLRPGKMLLVDTVKGELVDDEKLKADYASRQHYGEWLDRNLVPLSSLKVPNKKVPSYTKDQLVQLQKAFGYRYEDVSTIILPMAKNGGEPAGAMGSDTPLAVLSHTRPNLSEYFKQMFAQVTNPPIDALREKIVTSTTVYVGAQGNLLEEDAANCKVLKIENPILTETDLLKIKAMDVPGFKVVTLSISYNKNTDLEKAIERLIVDVDRAYRDGANILILSDRDIDEYHVAIPSLLAVGAVFALALPWDVLWRYFSWANQTLAMIVLWTGAVFLHKFGYPPKACFIAALPATFMSAVSVTYFFQAPECLGQSTAIAYPVGIVAAALFLGIFIWRTLIVGKDDVAPLHAAKN